MGQLQPRRALVVQVRQRALLQIRILRGRGHDGRLADQPTRRFAAHGRDVGEIVLRINSRGDRVDPLRRVQPPLTLGVQRLGRAILAPSGAIEKSG